MRIKSNSGQILAIVILFIIVSAISSVAMYYWAFSISKEVAIQSPAYMRNYYAAVAGQRFATILLQDPSRLDPNSALRYPMITSGSITTPDHDGETVTLTISPNSDFGRDIKLRESESMIIEIKEYDPEHPTDTPWASNHYNTTVTLIN